MQPTKDTISDLTNELIKVSDYDIQIYSDQLKYSEWFLAIATAGFSLCIAKYDHFVINSWLAHSAIIFPLFILSVLLFVLSAACGVFHKYSINVINGFIRKRMTILLKQNIVLGNDDGRKRSLPTDINELSAGVMSCAFWDSERRNEIALCNLGIDAYDDNSSSLSDFPSRTWIIQASP